MSDDTIGIGRPCRIMLDPGHGGSATGGAGHGLVEKDLNLEVGLACEDLLRSCGHTVLMTRTTDVDVSLSTRGCRSVNEDCDLFVSIHHDAGRESMRGCHGFAHRETYRNGMDLARRAAEGVRDSLSLPGFSYGGPVSDWFGKNLGVLSSCGNAEKVTACLVECLFLTNAEDAKITRASSYAYRAAAGIARGIQHHLGLPDPIIEPDADLTPVKIVRYRDGALLATVTMVPDGDHLADQRKLYVADEVL